MMANEIALAALIVLGAVTAAGGEGRRPGKERAKGSVEMVMARAKDAAVRADGIATSAGATVGFRIEVVNPSTEANLVLALTDDLSSVFDIRLLAEGGTDISPLRPRAKPGAEQTRYDIIPPRTSRAWFLPCPSQVRSDPRKPTNEGNLERPKKGEYLVGVRVALPYFTQDKAATSLPETPSLQTLRLALPPLSVVIDPDSLGQDVVERYLTWEYQLVVQSEQAIDIARKAIEGHMQYDKSLKIEVVLEDGGIYRITFPFRLPPGALGPDYAARVWVDGKTGKVIRMLGAS